MTAGVSPEAQFYVQCVVSCIVFIGILYFAMRTRAEPLEFPKVLVVVAIVVAGGMLLARFGAQIGMPWWIYYTVPMLVTVLLPPIVFSMTMREAQVFVVLAFLSAPVIHIAFSLFLGWHGYMPFLPVPSLQELVGAA